MTRFGLFSAAVVLAIAGCGLAPGGDSSLPVDDADATAELSVPPVFRTNAACPATTSSDPLVVSTDRGPIKGKRSNGANAFLGVPFAKPPVGEGRFAPPRDLDCHSQVMPAIDYGHACAQSLLGVQSGDEDCLFLNVWTPKVDSTAKLPVLFFVHGGAEVLGSSSQNGGLGNLYEGASFARNQNVVVVSVNYRLGPLGFLSHPALDAETVGGTSGNYGLQDIITALEWTQANITKLGGDPKRVMLFGESAGALNTCALLASPLAKGRFTTALMESGACEAAPPAVRAAQAKALIDDLKCKGTPSEIARCLRAKPVSKLTVEPLDSLSILPVTKIDLQAAWYLGWGPTIDGKLLTQRPIEAIRKGEHNHMPFVIGTNADETELFMPAIYNTCFDVALDQYQRLGPDLASAVSQRYPCFSYLLARHAQVAWTTDAQFTCEARRIARAMAANQSQPVYRYRYTHIGRGSAMTLLRATHTAELPFVFDTVDAWGGVATPAEQKMTSALQSYWASFAGTKTPRAPGAAAWPRYTTASERVLVLDQEPAAAAKPESDPCDLWDSVTPG